MQLRQRTRYAVTRLGLSPEIVINLVWGGSWAIDFMSLLSDFGNIGLGKHLQCGLQTHHLELVQNVGSHTPAQTCQSESAFLTSLPGDS